MQNGRIWETGSKSIHLRGKVMQWKTVPRDIDTFLRKCAPRKHAEPVSDSKIPTNGQRMALRTLAKGLCEHGMLLADDVGMGKTLIASHLAHAVAKAGGRVAILTPRGLIRQWKDELQDAATYWPKKEIYSIEQTSDLTKEDYTAKEHFPQICLVSQTLLLCKKDEIHPIATKIFNWRHGKKKQTLRGAPLLSQMRAHFPKDLDEKRRFLPKRNPYFLEKCLVLLLGTFDFVIIDEAHKNRSETGSLGRLLEYLIQEKTSRRLGMTATPIELNSKQWHNTLNRLEIQVNDLSEHIETLEKATTTLKQGDAWKSKDCRKNYKEAAYTFEQALRPYLIRRGKREDDAVKIYLTENNSPLSCYAYRQFIEQPIHWAQLDDNWKEILCAAEACSLTAKPEKNDETAAACRQRLEQRGRLTVANGHCLTLWLEGGNNEKSHPVKKGTGQHKRQDRWNFWRHVLKSNLPEDGLYQHPHIMKAAEAILNITDRGEKVLVFGVFLKPLRALTLLLNAHAMLDSLKLWLKRKAILSDRHLNGCALDDDCRVKALQAALKTERQSFWHDTPFEKIRDMLQQQYDQYENQQKKYRNHIRNTLPSYAEIPDFRSVFARWLEEEYGTEALSFDRKKMSEVLRKLRERCCGTPAQEEDMPSDVEAKEIVSALTEEDDTTNPRSTFARLLYGKTDQFVRFALQDAFNRSNSQLRVLVAQSRVGREGLNLHRSCRHVFLLHPEWNPGFIEQQIGRIDRIDSLWSRMVLGHNGKDADPSAQLCVTSIIFEGTYDAFQWQVLCERKNMLHGQLYGDPVPEIVAQNAEEKKWLREIIDAAPDFSPQEKA